MNTPNDGGPAFPHAFTNDRSIEPKAFGGMSLRDWFAGMALQGIKIQADGPIVECSELHAIGTQVALGAYAIADAMLKAREKANERSP